MAKKSFVKKKEHRKTCWARVKEGLVNAADGTWKRADLNKQTDVMLINGYNFKR